MQNSRGLSRADVVALGVMAFVFGVVVFPAVAALEISRARELSNRVYCGANLKGIMSAMCVYGNDGDAFPLLTATSATTYDAAMKPQEGKASADDTVASLYADKLLPNNPMGGMWLLVLKNMTVPKQFICRSDPFAKTAAEIEGKESDKFFINFQEGTQISYSVAYPWSADKDGKVQMGMQWRADRTDSSLPIISDMAPYLSKNGKADEIATRPAVVAATQEENVVVMGHGNGVALEATSNSANHQFDGEMVGFGDAHAEFVRRPDVGQNNDNIWTEKVENVETVIDAGELPTALTADSNPLDIVMVPTRSAKGELK